MTDLQIEKYREHLTVLNYSASTIKAHLFYIHRFRTYLKTFSIEAMTAVTKQTVRDYQIHLYEAINKRGEPNSVATQNNALKGVKSFFRFLYENDYLVSNPARDVSYARMPKRLPRSILTAPEMKKLLRGPDTKTAMGYRDRTLMEVLYSTGMRKQEVNNLLLQDVDYQDGIIRINSGKGQKDRVVPIGKIASRYLENYIKAVRPSFIRNPYNQHLFLSQKGNKLSKNVVWTIVKRYRQKIKLKKNISPHSFRHTCATLMLRNKANIRHIQEMLGHASLDSTQVYTSVSITDLKEVHSRCHPREREAE